MPALEELQALYASGQLIPFIGAGVSASVEWKEGDVQKQGPSWEELVDRAALLLDFEDAELLAVRGTALQILEYFRIRNDGEFAKLTNWLSANLSPPDDALSASPIHAALAELVRCKVLYTTNFDNFLERSFGLHSRKFRTVVVESHMGLSPEGDTECEIVKFHGDLNYPSRMVLSETDYEQRLQLKDPMDLRLRSDLLGRAVLFLGYSFRDPNVSYLFRLMQEMFGSLPASPSGRRAYITVPDPSDFEIRLFRARNIEVVPIRGTRRTHEMADLVRQLPSES